MKIAPHIIIEMSDKDEFIDNNRFEKFKSKKKKLSSGNDMFRIRPEAAIYNSDKDHVDRLINEGVVDELLSVIKSGKEATVYLGRCRSKLIAVKMYTDIRVRSFRRDDVYRQGRYIGSKRIEKAIEQGSEFGLNAHQLIWVGEEFAQMKLLHAAGVPVPFPVALSGLAIVMDFIGKGNGEAAPRLSDVSLSREEAQDAFTQSLNLLSSFVSLGKVHGDFSAYNILWHESKAYAIDFPQMIDINLNDAYKELLRRDVCSLCKTFRRHGIFPDEERTIEELRQLL
jgi:RIO kinase 1